MDTPEHITYRLCEVKGCTRKHAAKGFCRMHYHRDRNYGDTEKLIRFTLSFKESDTLKEFLFKYRNITENGCWEWTRTKSHGYGEQKIDGKKYRTHRISKAIFHGFDINSPLDVCHRCDNPPCFNPEHLFVGTHQDNMWDKVKKGRSNVPKGIDQHFAKLDENKVREIRKMRESGMTLIKISRCFSLGQTTIGYVCQRKTWKHVV